jgi:hypothetical protein
MITSSFGPANDEVDLPNNRSFGAFQGCWRPWQKFSPRQTILLGLETGWPSRDGETGARGRTGLVAVQPGLEPGEAAAAGYRGVAGQSPAGSNRVSCRESGSEKAIFGSPRILTPEAACV